MISTCAQCGKTIINKDKRNRKYCSPKCTSTASNARYMVSSMRNGSGPDRVSTGSIGTISELLVCQDLLKRGFHVFKAVSPSCPCDLVAMKHGNLFKVEVTTGRRYGTSGKLHFPTKDPEKFHLLAVVVPETNEVLYTPEM